MRKNSFITTTRVVQNIIIVLSVQQCANTGMAVFCKLLFLNNNLQKTVVGL